ncbi:4249_t:CDS:10, partial [Racocetra fulgida]
MVKMVGKFIRWMKKGHKKNDADISISLRQPPLTPLLQPAVEEAYYNKYRLLLSAVIHGYTITEEWYSGSTNNVCKGIKDSREYALKFFKDEAAFKNEVAILTLLKNSQVENMEKIIVLEHGICDLQTYIRKPTWIQSRQHTDEIKKKIVKGAENLGTWKLIDFDTSRKISAPTTINTVNYCCPEVAKADFVGKTKKAHPSMDMFSFGLVLFFIETGYHYWKRRDLWSIGPPLTKIEKLEFLRSKESLTVSVDDIDNVNKRDIINHLLKPKKQRMTLTQFKKTVYYSEDNNEDIINAIILLDREEEDKYKQLMSLIPQEWEKIGPQIHQIVNELPPIANGQAEVLDLDDDASHYYILNSSGLRELKEYFNSTNMLPGRLIEARRNDTNDFVWICERHSRDQLYEANFLASGSNVSHSSYIADMESIPVNNVRAIINDIVENASFRPKIIDEFKNITTSTMDILELWFQDGNATVNDREFLADSLEKYNELLLRLLSYQVHRYHVQGEYDKIDGSIVSYDDSFLRYEDDKFAMWITRINELYELYIKQIKDHCLSTTLLRESYVPISKIKELSNVNKRHGSTFRVVKSKTDSNMVAEKRLLKNAINLNMLYISPPANYKHSLRNRWMEPQQLLNPPQSKLDFKSDIYSMAILFWEITDGRGTLPHAHVPDRLLKQYVVDQKGRDGLPYDDEYHIFNKLVRKMPETTQVVTILERLSNIK